VRAERDARQNADAPGIAGLCFCLGGGSGSDFYNTYCGPRGVGWGDDERSVVETKCECAHTRTESPANQPANHSQTANSLPPSPLPPLHPPRASTPHPSTPPAPSAPACPAPPTHCSSRGAHCARRGRTARAARGAPEPPRRTRAAAAAGAPSGGGWRRLRWGLRRPSRLVMCRLG